MRIVHSYEFHLDVSIIEDTKTDHWLPQALGFDLGTKDHPPDTHIRRHFFREKQQSL